MKNDTLTIMDALRVLDDGGTLEELTRELRRTAAAVDEHGKDGTVTLKLKVSKLGRHQLAITGDVNGNPPRRAADPSVFFVTDSGDISRSNPDQMRLGAPVGAGKDEE